MGQQIDQREERSGGRGLSLGQAWLAVYKRISAVAALPLVAAIGMAAVVYSLPDRYAAAVMIQIDPQQKLIAEPDTAWPQAEHPGIEGELEALQSPPLLDRVIGALRLDEDPEFKPRRLAVLFDKLFLRSSPETQTRKAIAGGLTVNRLRSTYLVSVRFTSGSPEKSARVANAIVDAYLKQQQSRFPASVADSDKSAAAATRADDATASERMFQSLLARYGLNRERQGARVLVKAVPPHAPAGPKRLELVAEAFAAGLIIAITIALLLEREVLSSARTRYVERTLACRHMTSLPAMARHEIWQPPARAARLIIAEPACRYATAVRHACDELERRRTKGASRLVLVVSALPGEGAEHFASNLAHSLAIAGEAPLLVDADLRMKSLTRQLAPQCAAGLLDQIAGQRPVEEAILRDGTTGLCFLPAAGPAPIPLSVPGALRSTNFATAIAELKQRFATLIVSAPPLLPVSDARIIAELADEIVFVTAWHRTPRSLATKALTSLEANQRKVIGAVLTDIAENDHTAPMSLAAIFDEIRRTALVTLAARAA